MVEGMSSATLTAGLRLRGLTKSFGPVRAVDGVDLDVVAGETIALLGPNGAGKSTTIDMMLGLTRPDAGDVRVFGTEPARATQSGLVGAMLQTGGLLGYVSVRELVELTGSFYRRPMPVDEVLQRAGVTAIAAHRTDRLSGGQAQRVRFALALVPDPQLLILDEPTVAMDVETRRGFWASMREFAASGRTILFATHYLDEADSFADRVLLMAQGRLVADGPPTAIKSVVGDRTIRCTLPEPDADRLGALPGVGAVELYGESVLLRCTDADAALRALLPAFPAARDIEVTGADLEEAFLALTAGPHTTEESR
jgi:ABC-2 type transport system ATP-binding protein